MNAIFVFFQCNINLYFLYRQTIHYLNILISLGTALPSNTTGGPSILNYFWFAISFPLFFTLEIPILTSSSSRYFLLTFTRQLKQQLLREDFHSLLLNRYAMPTNLFLIHFSFALILPITQRSKELCHSTLCTCHIVCAQ